MAAFTAGLVVGTFQIDFPRQFKTVLLAVAHICSSFGCWLMMMLCWSLQLLFVVGALVGALRSSIKHLQYLLKLSIHWVNEYSQANHTKSVCRSLGVSH